MLVFVFRTMIQPERIGLGSRRGKRERKRVKGIKANHAKLERETDRQKEKGLVLKFLGFCFSYKNKFLFWEREKIGL